MDLYSEEFFDQAKNPKNVGKFLKPDGYSQEVNAFCGDAIKIYIKDGKIRYEVAGCMVSKATASILSKKKTEEIEKMTREDLLKLLGIKLTPTRVRCAMLPLVAIQKALRLRSE